MASNNLNIEGSIDQCLAMAINQLVEKRGIFRIENLKCSLFLIDFKNDCYVSRQKIKDYLFQKFSQIVIKSTTREEYLSETHKVKKNERKNGTIVEILKTLPLFQSIPRVIQNNIVAELLKVFCGVYMEKMEIGVDTCETQHKLKMEKETKLRLENPGNSAVLYTENKIKIKPNHDVTRYVAGFSAKALIKKKCPMELMDTMIKGRANGSSDNEEQDDESWLNKLSRGGLIKVTDIFFDLIREIKNISDLIYQVDVRKIRHRNLKINTISHVLQNQNITSKWEHIYKNDKGFKWLKKLLDVFLNTRAKCLIRDILERYQHDTKETIRAKKALRKDLKAKSEAKKAKAAEKVQNKLVVAIAPPPLTEIYCPNNAISNDEQQNIPKLANIQLENTPFNFLTTVEDGDLFLQYLPIELNEEKQQKESPKKKNVSPLPQGNTKLKKKRNTNLQQSPKKENISGTLKPKKKNNIGKLAITKNNIFIPTSPEKRVKLMIIENCKEI